jgi:hypothetical protein
MGFNPHLLGAFFDNFKGRGSQNLSLIFTAE